MKFVSLHNHDGHSVYDALGSPGDLAEWMLENAGEESGALAITNHGSMNSIGYLAAAQKKYEGKAKFIYGVEAYYVPSLSEWSKAHLEQKEEKKKKKGKSSSAFVIENEAESKSLDQYDILKRRHHLVVLAQNQKGLENLYRAVSRSYREGFYRKPRMDFEMLKEHNEGLIVSTACLAGIPTWCSLHPSVESGEIDVMDLYQQELGPLMEVFGKDRFFLELQFNKIEKQKTTNRHLMEFAKKTGHQLIATCDTHYARPEMWKDRALYQFLGYQMQKQEFDINSLDKSVDDLDCHLYLKNGDQMFAEAKLSHQGEELVLAREAIERTYGIAHDFIEDVYPDSSYKLPKTFQVTEQIKTPFDELKRLTLAGLKEKGLTSKEYVHRAAYELKVIKDVGTEEYFLAKRDILNILKQHMLIGPARGSAGGSLVCYLIGITMMDPLKYGLLFERFMSAGRKEMPDVDSDIELKDQSLDILKDHFGEKNVLTISNYNRLQLKSLVKDISRLYGVPFAEVNEVTKVMEEEARDKIMADIGFDQKFYEFTFDKAKEYSPTFRNFLTAYPDIETHIKNLFQQIKAIGRHAGGVLVVPDAEGQLPIMKIRGVDQSPISEGIAAQHLEYFGLIKFDVLGLATLRIIRRCIEEILKSKGVTEPTIEDVWEFYDANLHPDIIDPADKKVFKHVYHKGKWPSIFQFAETGVQSFCKQAKPTSVDDLSAITSIWRPGPLKGKANERYVAAEPSDIKKEHPIIQEVLGETRGILIYQEQFMLLANKLAGFTLEEANKLRKLLVKPMKTLATEMKEERIKIGKKFVDGCIEKGLPPERAKNLWEKEILGFISYGFNHSHAQAYAFNSYQCAWLFTYYDEFWIKACLECDPDLNKTINVVRSLGFVVSNPDINVSESDTWQIAGDSSCVPALTSLKGIGQTAADELIRFRPKEGFKNLQDFLFDADHWRWSKFNKKSIETMIKVEGFSSLGCVGPGKLFENYNHMANAMFTDKNFLKIKAGKLTLEKAASTADYEDIPVSDKITIQKEIMGFYNKDLIVGEFLPTFENFEIQAIDKAGDKKKKTHIWAIVEKITQKTTKTGKPFLIVEVTGLSDKPYSFKVWNEKVEESSVWKEGYIVVFSLDYQKQWGYSLSRKEDPLRITK